MNPNQYCEQKLRQSGSSFYFSFVFLDDTQKQAMTALYAFCREVDDIVDSAQEKDIARAKLLWWQSEIASIYSQKANHPIAKALQQALENYPLKLQYFLDIIAGMEMDLDTKTYSTFKELKQYCYYAASAVGLLSIEIMGYREENKDSIKIYAKKLGIALQLTNILRDVKEDKERQRIYLPQEDLAQFNLSTEQLHIDNTTSSETNLKLQQLFQFQYERAQSYYQEAYALIQNNDRHSQRMGLMMAEVYAQLLEKIKAKHFPVLDYRVRLHPLNKLWIVWKTARREEKFNGYQ